MILREMLMTGCLAPEDVELLLASTYGDVAAARRGIGLKHWPPPVAQLEQRLREIEVDS